MVTCCMVVIAEPKAFAASCDCRSASSHSLIAPESDASRATILLRHLFSIVYKLLFRQLLSFHIHTNPRGGWGAKANAKRKHPTALDSSHVIGSPTTRFPLLVVS